MPETSKLAPRQDSSLNQTGSGSFWQQWNDVIITVAVTLAVVLLVTNFLYKPVRVDGSSMYPTLYDKSLGFAGILERTQGIKRFDIVVIQKPDSSEKLVKRVIGLPGETVTFADDILYIDGVVYEQDFLDEEYVNQQKATQSDNLFTKNFTVTLGDDEYFCMGDNRLHSSDSRYYGPFTSQEIIQVHVYIYWPFSKFGKAG